MPLRTEPEFDPGEEEFGGKRRENDAERPADDMRTCHPEKAQPPPRAEQRRCVRSAYRFFGFSSFAAWPTLSASVWHI